MEVIGFITALDSSTKLVIAYVVAAIVAGTTSLFRRRPTKRSHEWRIKSAARVLDKLKVIGKEKGPAAQLTYVRQIDCFAFEEALLSSIEREGHRVKRNECYTGDGGVDGEFVIDGISLLLQAKRYQGHIDREDVAAFVALCAKRKMHGVFAHSGRTSVGTWALGDGFVVIVSGAKLLACLGVAADRSEPKPWRSVVYRAAKAGWQS